VVNVTEQIIQLFGLETDFKVARHAGIQKTLKRIRERNRRMRHEMSLRGGIFNDAVDLFDTKLRDVLNTLLRQGLSEGSVTLKVNVELWNVGEQDENGIYHETNKTHFDYNVTSAITQKNKSNGEVKEMLKLRCVDGQLELRDLDENTLFDIVEGGVQDGAQPDRDGTPG
jgi:hypothetical protein